MARDFAEFIAEKGVGNLHIVTGAKPNTIYSWTFKNLIPRNAWPELIEAYPDISLVHLKRWESRAHTPADNSDVDSSATAHNMATDQ